MRRFLECLIPLTACNLKCSYCYVIQESRRKNEMTSFQYAPEYIGKALSAERLGGACLISMTASGETFLAKELPEITKEILKQGHFVNITTNGTLTKQMANLMRETEGMHSRLHISFSFHYLELKNKNLLDVFFDNIRTVREAGCSILLQINLCDDYMPYWDEIKRLSVEHVGAYPQVALTRLEKKDGFEVLTKKSFSEYVEIGREMNSPLFEFTCKNFNVKRCEFCYAGLWSAKLNLATGEMTGCYGNGVHQNILKDLTKPIKWIPIGNNCYAKYCFNSSHFLSQGVIPEIMPQPSYGELRNREEANWYTSEMKAFLYEQFEQTNPLLTESQKQYFNCRYRLIKILKKIKRGLKL